MEPLFAKYGYAPDKELINKRLDTIAANIDNVTSPEVLTKCLSLMDLTTLRTEDTPESVKKLTGNEGLPGLSASGFDLCFSEFRICRKGEP